MRLSCPHCGKALNVKDGLAGKKAKCPGCKKVFLAPRAGGGPHSLKAQPAGGDCPNCDEPLAPGAVLCVRCGYDTRTGRILKTDFGRE